MSHDEGAESMGNIYLDHGSTNINVEVDAGDTTPMGFNDPQPNGGVGRSFVPAPISVAIDPVALITTECITVTSAMRKHARWAHSSVAAILGGGSISSNSAASSSTSDGLRRKGYAPRPTARDDTTLANRWGLRGKKGKSMQDNPLMAGFSRLRRELVGCKGTVIYQIASYSRSTNAR